MRKFKGKWKLKFIKDLTEAASYKESRIQKLQTDESDTQKLLTYWAYQIHCLSLRIVESFSLEEMLKIESNR